MSVEMKLKEDTSTRIVLESDPSKRKWGEYLRTLVIPPLVLAGILIFMNLSMWLNWVIIVIAVLIEAFMAMVVYSEVVNATVTIEFTSLRATREEKFIFIRTKFIELDLKKVERVLFHVEEVGHHCRMLLEAENNNPFEIDFYLPTSQKQDAMFILGKKIGNNLQKPAVLKVTDQGNLISEETI